MSLGEINLSTVYMLYKDAIVMSIMKNYIMAHFPVLNTYYRIVASRAGASINWEWTDSHLCLINTCLLVYCGSLCLKG